MDCSVTSSKAWMGHVAAGLVALVGCGGRATAPLPQSGAGLSAQRTVREELAESAVRAVLVPAASHGSVVGHAVLQSEVPDAPLELGARGGAISVALDAAGNLSIPEAHLALADLELTPEQLPPSGLRLSHLALDLQRPVAVTPTWYANGAEGAASLQADFVLSGQLESSDGGPSPFEPQPLQALRVDVELSTDEFDDVLAHFHVAEPGVVWSWQGLYELRELSFDGQAIAAVEPE